MTASKKNFPSLSSFDVVFPFAGDPFVGHLATPITTSEFTRSYLSELPAYKLGISPFLRGTTIGFVHAYFLFGPFVSLGPLRTSSISGFIGLLSTLSLLLILTACLGIYGYVSFSSKEPSENSELAQLQSRQGWQQFTSGFLVGGFAGSCLAYSLFEFFPLSTFLTN